MIPPSRPATALDLGERCQLIIGQVGYNFTNGSKVITRAQRARNDSAVFISPSDHLSMRDYDYWSRVFMDDFRKGFGQVAYAADDALSKARFFWSNKVDVSEIGQVTPFLDIAPNRGPAPIATNAISVLHAAGTFLYRIDTTLSAQFSDTWTTTASTVTTSARPVEMEDDGQFVYFVVDGFGIQRKEVGLAGAAAQWTGALAVPGGVAIADGATGGSLLSATQYCYRVSATNGLGETTASVEVCLVTGAGPNTHRLTVTWNAVTGATGYRVYGRTGGGELFLATVVGQTKFLDDGSATPSGPLPTGTMINPTSLLRIAWTNRLIFGIDATTLYSWNPLNAIPVTPLALFALPTGWTMADLAAKRGGSIDSPIVVMATNGARSFLWQWDGSTIHDYLQLPAGFIGCRLKFYLGTLFILGYSLSQNTGVANPCVYYVQNDQLGFAGYLDVPIPLSNTQGYTNAMGAGSNGTTVLTTPAAFTIDAFEDFVYFGVSLNAFTNAAGRIWRYDLVNGGLSLFQDGASAVTPPLAMYGMAIWKGSPAWQIPGQNLGLRGNVYGSNLGDADTYQIITSDLTLGQPWAPNLWTIIELVHTAIRAGESILVYYSTDQGGPYTGTFTLAATINTVGRTSSRIIISNATIAVLQPFIRVKCVFTRSGATPDTIPFLYSITVKAAPTDPPGLLMEATLACPDQSEMPNDNRDWQGLSGSERIFNIVSLFETQAPVNVIYMAPNNQRAKNPKTVVCKVVDYELTEPSALGSVPDNVAWVEGDIKVTLREVV